MSTAPPTPSPIKTEPLSDAALADHAAQVLDAALSSASVSTIGARHWWDRATSALRTAASSGGSWQRIVSRLAAKLQIDVLSDTSARALAGLGEQLADPVDLGRWCYIAAHDTPYIVAMTRITRTDRRDQETR